MKKPKIVVIDDERAIRNYVKDTIDTSVRELTGIPFDVQRHTRCPKKITKLSDASMFLIDFFMPGRKGNQVAQDFKDAGFQGERVLITGNLPEVIEYLGISKKSWYERSAMHNAKVLQEFYNLGLHRLFPRLLTKPFEPEELTEMVIDLREKRRIRSPLKMGVIGLGKLGLRTLQEMVRKDWVTKVGAYTGFAKGSQDEYRRLLDSMDLSGEERKKIVTHGALEELIETEPDVIIIATGEHNTPYGDYSDRTELTKRLFQNGLPKIDPVLRRIKESGCKSLLAMESNPNGHFIQYALKLGIDPSQLTSFSPDTMRHVKELYDELRKVNESVREESIALMVIGDHMKGGTAAYHEATVDGRPLIEFDPRFENRRLQSDTIAKARKQGLRVMTSSKEYEHDYGGVPLEIVKNLEEIAHFQQRPKDPIYAGGLISVPATYEYPDNDKECYPRVHPEQKNITYITEDRYARKEVPRDVERIKDEVEKWTE